MYGYENNGAYIFYAQAWRTHRCTSAKIHRFFDTTKNSMREFACRGVIFYRRARISHFRGSNFASPYAGDPLLPRGAKCSTRRLMRSAGTRRAPYFVAARARAIIPPLAVSTAGVFPVLHSAVTPAHPAIFRSFLPHSGDRIHTHTGQTYRLLFFSSAGLHAGRYTDPKPPSSFVKNVKTEPCAPQKAQKAHFGRMDMALSAKKDLSLPHILHQS